MRLELEPVFSTGQSVLELDGGGRRSVVTSGLFQQLPCALRQRTVAPAVPRRPPRKKVTRPPCSFIPRSRNEMTGAPLQVSFLA